MAEVANCIHCGKIVGQRQRAVSCDACERWQHIGCDSGISLAEYKAATRGEREIHFLYAECCRSIPTIHSVPEDERVSHVDPDLTQVFKGVMDILHNETRVTGRSLSHSWSSLFLKIFNDIAEYTSQSKLFHSNMII
ncbi:uncharacterized protein LOC127878272 [Dreissena polymorpha]|uniref:uncharacterized protein LOC127878272 n=1 Tax=Dreissena polymorpha TaxID=45954 RepID=UPI002264D5A1|nr:uncharacterized protein LOC127878272 [Dreissena polymorpha]